MQHRRPPLSAFSAPPNSANFISPDSPRLSAGCRSRAVPQWLHMPSLSTSRSDGDIWTSEKNHQRHLRVIVHATEERQHRARQKFADINSQGVIPPSALPAPPCTSSSVVLFSLARVFQLCGTWSALALFAGAFHAPHPEIGRDMLSAPPDSRRQAAWPVTWLSRSGRWWRQRHRHTSH